MGFQTQVNAQQAPAVAGDFASANPRYSTLALGIETAIAAGAAAAIGAGIAGVLVGGFAFARNDTGIATSQHPGVASSVGFANRSGNVGLITTGYPPGEESLLIPQGQPLGLMSGGDFWAKFAAGATPGQKVYASYWDGSLSAAATATPSTEGVTASFATDVMTVTVAGASPIGPGMPVTSVGVAAGTYITGQTSGTAGGVGTYTLSSTPGTIAAQAATVTLNVETAFFIKSTAGNGELAIISDKA